MLGVKLLPYLRPWYGRSGTTKSHAHMIEALEGPSQSYGTQPSVSQRRICKRLNVIRKH